MVSPQLALQQALVLPIVGPEVFSALTSLGKRAHNYLSFPFTIGVFAIFLIWLGANIPNKIDLEWIKRGGGIVGNDHPPAYKFNAGQKGIYWIVVIGGTAVAASGYLLMFPFYATDIAGMQLAQIVHGCVAAGLARFFHSASNSFSSSGFRPACH